MFYSRAPITRPAHGEQHMARVLPMRWIINSDACCPSVLVGLNYSPSNPLEGEHTHKHTHAGVWCNAIHTFIKSLNRRAKREILAHCSVYEMWWISLTVKGLEEVGTIEWHLRTSPYTHRWCFHLNLVHDRRKQRGRARGLSVCTCPPKTTV